MSEEAFELQGFCLWVSSDYVMCLVEQDILWRRKFWKPLGWITSMRVKC
jgi:hypothetical protein